MARVILFFLLSTAFAYGGYHVHDVREFLPVEQRNWLGNIIENLKGKLSSKIEIDFLI